MKERLQLQFQEKQYRAMLTQYHFREADLEQLRCLGEILLRTAEPVIYYAPCRMLRASAASETEAGAEAETAEFASETDTGAETETAEPASAAAELEAVSEEQVRAGNALAVLVSLGIKVDLLQNEYTRKERLTEAYMIECIGMELLKRAYEQTAERVWKRYGLWISGFQFPGEHYPMELTEAVFDLLKPEEIAYNAAYMMIPKKTVVFMTTLQQDRQAGYCHVCDRCSNLDCPNRQVKTGSEEESGSWIVAEQAEENSSRGGAEQEEKSGGQRSAESAKLNYGYQRIFGKM